MAETQVPSDAEQGWNQLSSNNGADYRVKASDYDINDKPADSADEPSASGPSFKNVKVHWTVGSEGVPSEDVQDETGITWYKLDKAEWWSPYTYKLTIVAKDTYNYVFYDESGDYYTLGVWQNAGTHSVEYRSGKPTIVSISGS
ncbi:hypothetical protein ACKAV7_000155 [Fusarium commune]|uniref:Uncharacterized protein n=1 Tax=Fusarium oxysporum f. sp. rapae TaxID=485398 RepID=A0A8J5PF27_FUSOX|nr:hypothetical protein Forpe1208_v001837 [Fusarium oxysporum f. sp. rapae]